ncbi:uncharacterized protein BJ171DRAFT_498567 [Polychytrium aggregatum]|uniref:uncharacterized protein n=1 Tax=Polychytrium aggregatum TaxID=110093 RepID=UPI0022FE48F6|nr:uncharacterized protein BJ171DRAFT_498567 [Polychytrium aggregatum]KAI9206064.1 hypothetical protein BJ171DRAFT_498567 [Polychytrium aggregatum]
MISPKDKKPNAAAVESRRKATIKAGTGPTQEPTWTGGLQKSATVNRSDWNAFNSEFSFPRSKKTTKKIAPQPVTLLVTAGLEEAKRQCREKVARIARECRERNVRFRDSNFDLYSDTERCLYNLLKDKDEVQKEGVQPAKRIGQIFENPVFFAQEGEPGDIKQGSQSDCWFLAAVSTLRNCKHAMGESLISQICIDRDEQVGVYGFLFFKDGDWISTVVDDQLFVKEPDFHWADSDIQKTLKNEYIYKKVMLTGSESLYFSSCEVPNETWLPLLEKAYAKIHGDYEAISGGIAGEAVEDLTGGVTTILCPRDILDIDTFWTKELTRANENFLFACWIDRPPEYDELGNLKQIRATNGLIPNHSYSVISTHEEHGKRFVKLRNPWGRQEWNGPWSDGSHLWTPEWMARLDHHFGDDGVFWMEYSDFLQEWSYIDRTRLFDSSWTVAQHWVEAPVHFPGQFGQIYFDLTIHSETNAIVVLSQLDTRYFKMLEGQYDFIIHFRIHRDGSDDYFVRNRTLDVNRRSVNVELQLKPGCYQVHVKVEREYNYNLPLEDVVKSVRPENWAKCIRLNQNMNISRSQVMGPQPRHKKAEVELQFSTETASRPKVQKQPSLSHGPRDSPTPEPPAEVLTLERKKGKKAVYAAETEILDVEEAYLSDPESSPSEDDDDDEDLPCVAVGLRVYSHDPQMSVRGYVRESLEPVNIALHSPDPEDVHYEFKTKRKVTARRHLSQIHDAVHK